MGLDSQMRTELTMTDKDEPKRVRLGGRLQKGRAAQQVKIDAVERASSDAVEHRCCCRETGRGQRAAEWLRTINKLMPEYAFLQAQRTETIEYWIAKIDAQLEYEHAGMIEQWRQDWIDDMTA